MFTYVGEIEEVRYSTVLGWAVDALRPDEPVRVALAVDGESVAETVTNREHRFEMVAPGNVMSNTAVEVLLYDEEGTKVQSLVWGESARRVPPEWKSGSHMAFPSFFLVGAAKSGTTSLHVYLDQHPDIFMSKPKEPFFFEAEYDRGPAYYYRRYFGGWNGQREVGESRHRNLYLPYIPARIHQYNPEARIIAILRNPAERAVSHWRHCLRGGFDWHARGKESLGLFDALQADLKRIQSGAPAWAPEDIARYAADAGDEWQGAHRTYLDTGYYLEQLARYEALFGRSRMHVVLADDLFQEPQKTMAGVFSFLGVGPSFAATQKYEIFNDAPAGKDQQVSAEVWQWLVDHYKPYNQALEGYLGRSLGMWNRPSVAAAGYWRRASDPKIGMKEPSMSPRLEESPAIASPLINAHHADVSQPWSGQAEITVEVQPNPGLGPVTLEVSIENSEVILAKEISDPGISEVRFGIQTDLLPDGPAVLMFTARQDKFIWESGLAFSVSNPKAVIAPKTNDSDVMWRQYGESAPVENEPRWPAQPYSLAIPNSVLRESSSVSQLETFYVIAEAWGHMVMHFLPENPVVLDIGCSCGKLARFLYMNPLLRYVGVDIFLPAIEWCRQAFAPLAGDRFRFEHFDGYSAVYNPQGKIHARDYNFPVDDRACNAVVCASLFTHLLEPDCVHYLAEISRVLAPGGRAIISIHTKTAEGQRFSGDEARIDIDQDYFVQLASQAGLRLLQVVGRVYGQQVLVFES
jgi:SAM-dependent methyltransferase